MAMVSNNRPILLLIVTSSNPLQIPIKIIKIKHLIKGEINPIITKEEVIIRRKIR